MPEMPACSEKSIPAFAQSANAGNGCGSPRYRDQGSEFRSVQVAEEKTTAGAPDVVAVEPADVRIPSAPTAIDVANRDGIFCISRFNEEEITPSVGADAGFLSAFGDFDHFFSLRQRHGIATLDEFIA